VSVEESLLSAAGKTEVATQDAEAKAPVQTDAEKSAEGADKQVDAETQKPADGEGGDKTETKAPVVPEKYELKMPEGYELNEAVASEFETFAKEQGLTQETAQKYADIGAKLIESNESAKAEAWANQRKTWREEVAADPEVGGKALAENMGYAARAIDTFAPELREVFDASGWGDNPAFVKAFIRIGKAISEDRLVGGVQQNGVAKPAPESVLYGTK